MQLTLNTHNVRSYPASLQSERNTPVRIACSSWDLTWDKSQIRQKKAAEHHSTSASYLEGPGLKSWPGNWLS
jgi:hypothetical protein